MKSKSAKSFSFCLKPRLWVSFKNRKEKEKDEVDKSSGQPSLYRCENKRTIFDRYERQKRLRYSTNSCHKDTLFHHWAVLSLGITSRVTLMYLNYPNSSGYYFTLFKPPRIGQKIPDAKKAIKTAKTLTKITLPEDCRRHYEEKDVYNNTYNLHGDYLQLLDTIT